MRVALTVAVAGVTALPAHTARACECSELDAAGEARAIAASVAVFDGWVIAAPHPWRCAVPPAPRSRAGCVRVAVVRADDCGPRGDLMELVAADGAPMKLTSIDDDATTFCGIKPGKYTVALSPRWIGEEDGTVDHGRTLDVAPGGSYVVFASARVGQQLRIGVTRTIKGAVPREVDVVTEPACGTAFHRVGDGARFFAQRRDGTAFIVRGCSSSRLLNDGERAELVAALAATAAPAPQPPAKVPAKRGCASTSGAELGLLPLLWASRLRRRRRD